LRISVELLCQSLQSAERFVAVLGLGVVLATSGASVAHATELLYLNRCVGGCTVHAGNDDATTDTSSIPSTTSNLSEFDPAGNGAGDDATWNGVVACLERVYEPFAIDVTTVDPGSTPHREIMIAGTATELSVPPGTGAIAPFKCSGVPDSLSFAFANDIGNDVGTICWFSAQSAATTFGLDHEVLQADVMTYLDGCVPKAFMPLDAPCGEYSARDCYCGGTTQNSYELLGSRAGFSSVVFKDAFEDDWSCHWSSVTPP
jgi:hypothetical protein